MEIVGLDEAEFGQVCYPEFVIHAETDSGITHELDANGGVRAPTGAGRRMPTDLDPDGE